MVEKTICCLTGNSDIPADKSTAVLKSLLSEILMAIDDGYTHFITAVTDGVDLMFAAIVALLKETHGITLEAAIPYPAILEEQYNDIYYDELQKIIENCDIVKILSDRFSLDSYTDCNKYMVDCSHRVIDVYCEHKSFCIEEAAEYTLASEREIRHILL